MDTHLDRVKINIQFIQTPMAVAMVVPVAEDGTVGINPFQGLLVVLVEVDTQSH